MVVPTYNEAGNIQTLLEEIHDSLKAVDYEIIVVDDDSPDGTSKVAEELGGEYPVRVITRRDERGLSSAVLKGISESEGDVVAVMDADLSHSPEYLKTMLDEIGEHDIVVGSRLVKGGVVELWPFYRKLISEGARVLAIPLTHVKDFLSGYFMLKKEVVDGVELNPIGYKILLEILVKGRYGKVKEVPIIFRNRTGGKSKMTLSTHYEYVVHLMRLYYHKLTH